MYRIWLERALPTEYAPLVEGIAELLGPATATPDDPLAAIAEADAVIASARIQYNAALMRRASRLRVICRTGIGYDNIAVADATGHGIAVCNVPDGPSISTAEHAFALLLALAKNLVPASAVLRQPARADYFSMFTGAELAGLQLGLVGLGRIGRRVAAIGAAFDMRVVA